MISCTVLEEPEVEVAGPSRVSVMAGDMLTLSCDAIGYSPPFVTWRRNLMPLSQNPRYNFTSHNGFGVLRVSGAALEDAGDYHCEVISELHGSRVVLPSTRVEVIDST